MHYQLTLYFKASYNNAITHKNELNNFYSCALFLLFEILGTFTLKILVQEKYPVSRILKFFDLKI